jgi:hypothetical protein
VAYVHAELFGGHRFQTTVGWEDADIRLGPLITETEPGGEAESWYSVHTGRLAVNDALDGWASRGVNTGTSSKRSSSAVTALPMNGPPSEPRPESITPDLLLRRRCRGGRPRVTEFPI